MKDLMVTFGFRALGHLAARIVKLWRLSMGTMGMRSFWWPLTLIAFYGFSLSGGFSLGKFLVVAAVGLWLALGNSYRRPGDWRLLAYLAVIAVTACLSADPLTSMRHLWGTYTAGVLAALSLIPYWACVGPDDRKGIEAGLRFGAWLMAFVGLSQLAGHFLPYPLPGGHRVYSTMGSPIYVGAMVCLCWPFLESRFERLAVAALLVATGSRGAWLACAAGEIYLRWPGLSRRVKVWGTTAALAAFVAALSFRPGSDIGRVLVWKAAISGFKARPWSGWGPGNFIEVANRWRNPIWDAVYGATTQDQAHNLFFEALSTSGVFGLAGLLCLLWALWEPCDRKSRAALLGAFLVGMLEPLPLVVKALSLSVAASCAIGQRQNRLVSNLVKSMACNIFFCVMLLVCCDRLMTFYGDAPWSLSSVKAGIFCGAITTVNKNPQIKVVGAVPN